MTSESIRRSHRRRPVGRRVRRAAFAGAVLASIVLSGCGGDEPGGNGAARLPGGGRDGVAAATDDGPDASFVMRSDDGEVRVDTGSGSVPSDFPTSLAIPSGWQAVHGGRISADGVTVWTVTWSTTERATEAIERFAVGLPADLDEAFRSDVEADGVTTVLTAWEGTQLSVAASAMDGSASGEPTLVTLTVSDEPALTSGTSASDGAPAAGDAAAGDTAGEDAGGGLVGAVGGQAAVDALAELGIGAKAEGLAFALGGRYELVDDVTVRLILDDKTLDDQLFDCIVVGAIVDPGETVIVVYPDGQATC